MSYAFERRRVCPVCGAPPTLPPLVDLPFDTPPISNVIANDVLAIYSDLLTPKSLSDGRFVLAECGRCGLVYQQDVPGQDLLDVVYDGSTVDPSEGRGSRGFDTRRFYAFQVEQLVKYFGGRPAEIEVLDYGMGWGHWLQMAQAYGCRASGAEISKERASAAIPGIDLIPHDELPTGRFHFVNTEQVFEHLVDPAAEGARLVEALRPGGILRISVPNGGNIKSLLADPNWTSPKGSPRALVAVAPLEHVNCFSHDSLVAFGRSLGLRPMHFPTRQYLEPWERVRFAASAITHLVRRPKGTMLLFQKPAA